MKRFMLTMILLLAASRGYGAPNTPGSPTGVLVQFYESTWGTGDGEAYVSALLSKGYAVTEAAHVSPGTTAPSFGMSDFYALLDNRYGVWWIQTHGHASGIDGWDYGAISVEPYDLNSMAIRDLNWDFYIAHGWSSASIEKVTTADSYAIAIKSGCISGKFVSASSFVFNWSCGSSTWESSWGGRRVFCGFPASDANYAETFWGSMGGGSTVTNSQNGTIAVVGEGATILAPTVASTSFEFLDQIPEGGLDIQWTFNGATTGSISISSGLGTVCYQCWSDDTTFNARICPTGDGAIWILGAFQSPNGIPLAHPTSQWALFAGDNSAADVSFGVKNDTAIWRAGSEYQTAGYLVEASNAIKGVWEQIGPEHAPGFGEYELDVSAAIADGKSWFRLIEREESGNRIIHGYAQPSMQSVRPQMPSRAPTLDEFDQAITAHTAAVASISLPGGLVANVGDGEKMVCYTVAPFAAAVEQYNASFWRRYGYEVTVEVTPGYPQSAAEEDAQIAYLQSRIAANAAAGVKYHELWGRDNEFFYLYGERWPDYWNEIWLPIRLQMLSRFPAQPGNVVIPAPTIRDDLPRGQNISYWRPYFRSDKVYQIPGTVVTRIPVTDVWQIAAYALVMQETNDWWSYPNYGMSIGFFVGDLDHMSEGDGARALAAAELVRTMLLQDGHNLSEIYESEIPNPETRNQALVDQWNGRLGGMTNLNVMYSSLSGSHYPGNMYSKRDSGWGMDLVLPYLNHHPFFLAPTCGTAASWETDDAWFDYTPVAMDMMFHEAGASGFYGPGCGSITAMNQAIGFETTKKVIEDFSRPAFESIAIAEEQVAALNPDNPLILNQLLTMSKLGSALTRIGSVDAIVGVNDGVPGQALLAQNYPNPFNPKTVIRFATTREDHVSLKVFNVRGGLIATLVDGPIPSGQHQIFWNGTDGAGQRVASGTYFYRLEAEGRSITRKMLLLK